MRFGKAKSEIRVKKGNFQGDFWGDWDFVWELVTPPTHIWENRFFGGELPSPGQSSFGQTSACSPTFTIQNKEEPRSEPSGSGSGSDKYSTSLCYNLPTIRSQSCSRDLLKVASVGHPQLRICIRVHQNIKKLSEFQSNLM